MRSLRWPCHSSSRPVTARGEVAEKGLKGGALGLLSSVVIGVASTAPAYSLAATLGFVVAVVGLQAPIIVILAFMPILFVAIGYQRAEQAEPDCGTTFTWATKAFGPKHGMARRLGNHRGRRPGDGEPGAGRRAVPIPAVGCRRHRIEPDEWLGVAGRLHVDGRDDLHLLSRHRVVGEIPEGLAIHRNRHAGGFRGGCAYQCLHRTTRPACRSIRRRTGSTPPNSRPSARSPRAYC